MTIVRNNSPILRRDGTPAENHTVRVYRRDTGALLSQARTATTLGITETLEWVPSTNVTGWANTTERIVIDKTKLIVGNKIRITVNTSSSASSTVGSAYIGLAASSGEPYDFVAAPSQLFFSGNASVSLPVNNIVVSDWLSFTQTADRNLVISIYFSSSSGVRYNPVGPTDWRTYRGSGNTASTVDVSGYTDLSPAAHFVTKVEIVNDQIGAGYYIAPCYDYSGSVNVVCLSETSTENDLIIKTTSI